MLKNDAKKRFFLLEENFLRLFGTCHGGGGGSRRGLRLARQGKKNESKHEKDHWNCGEVQQMRGRMRTNQGAMRKKTRQGKREVGGGTTLKKGNTTKKQKKQITVNKTQNTQKSPSCLQPRVCLLLQMCDFGCPDSFQAHPKPNQNRPNPDPGKRLTNKTPRGGGGGPADPTHQPTRFQTPLGITQMLGESMHRAQLAKTRNPLVDWFFFCGAISSPCCQVRRCFAACNTIIVCGKLESEDYNTAKSHQKQKR